MMMTEDATRSRTITWTDPTVTRARLGGLNGYERLLAIKSGAAAPPPAASLLGMTLDELEPGRTVFSLVADELHENPMGTMHGGIVATLVDTAMGCAVSSRLDADETFTTLELSTNYVRAITQATGRIFAEGRVVHGGTRVATTEARVYDASGALYAHATSTCLITKARS
ncbi:MAG TPA: PaaI family thioesterase [Acidimicrobiia bacterium]|nr:PaaI family thioesterase [Acidimicrobiia bacterium]